MSGGGRDLTLRADDPTLRGTTQPPTNPTQHQTTPLKARFSCWALGIGSCNICSFLLLRDAVLGETRATVCCVTDTGAVVGAAVGGAVGLLLVVGAILYCSIFLACCACCPCNKKKGQA